MFSTLDPMQQIQSMGWMYRRAIGSGVSGIAIIGLWLILGPGLILSSAALIYGGIPRMDFAGFAQVLPFAALEIMFAVILYKGTRNYLRQRKASPDECKKCGSLCAI